MTTKRKSIFTMITSALLSTLLCFSMTLPVFAEPLPPGVVGAASEDKPANAAITKKLIMPAGTPTPTVTFTFTFEKFSFNNVEADKTKLPNIGTATADPLKSQTTLSFKDETGTENGGTKTIMKETPGLLGSVNWPNGGVYTYKVTEEATGFTANPGTNGKLDEMIFSKAVYELSIWVDNRADGKGLYVKYIAAKLVTAEKQGESVGHKVDPTPGGNSTTGTGFSDMVFTNSYLKNNGGVNPTDTVLAVSKTVAGNGSNQTDKYFKFDVTIKNPETVSGTKTYKAYVLEGTNVVSPLTPNKISGGTVKPDGNGKDYIEFAVTDSTAKILTIELKHGQKLSFIDLPVGAGFTAKEYAMADYTPGYALTAYKASEKKVASENITSQTMGIELTAPSTAFGTAYVSADNSSKADFTNTFKLIAPTGIGVDDLPYIALIAVTLIALTGYIGFRVRKGAKGKA